MYNYKKYYHFSFFIDLSKTFDTINYDILLDKIDYYRIRDLPLKWLKFYLSIRENEHC